MSSRSANKDKTRRESKDKKRTKETEKSQKKEAAKMPRSRSRSRSRSFSRGRNRGRQQSRSRSHSRSYSPEEGYRIHVADLGMDPSKSELDRAFEKFGPLLEVWVARNPPCFAFIVYKYREDAERAVQDMDGRVLSGGRIRVSFARPRTRGRRRRGFDPNLRCYTCGEKGHFSRDCVEIWRQRRRNRSRKVVLVKCVRSKSGYVIMVLVMIGQNLNLK
ncbi:serine/arginine-rich splicing factor 7-like isoform X4 [Mytilus californianus]|uniref:serine/arginine-rich splicing factor 7-like isoform X4 n=1 Tax=Mytilus californianus TaxID=6549 RepID=UPI002247811E|nr:serine/arginine-rich splicing factor 7-like isoform X4 [Mytilus californianus]